MKLLCEANCPNGHSLVSCTRKVAWYCDRCRKNMPQGTESMYCSRCDYDWCGTCSHQALRDKMQTGLLDDLMPLCLETIQEAVLACKDS